MDGTCRAAEVTVAVGTIVVTFFSPSPGTKRMMKNQHTIQGLCNVHKNTKQTL